MEDSQESATIGYGSEEYPAVAPNYEAGILPPTGGTQYTYGELAEKRNRTNWYLPVGAITVDVGGAVAPEDRAYLSDYLGELLKQRGVKGHYKIWKIECWKDVIWSFKFEKKGECPICKVQHDSYAFEYKVRKETYGGWKCWKSDSWETHYRFEELPRLVMCDFQKHTE